jgi:hypothetical protein
MAKEYSIEVGGVSKVLKYTHAERQALEAQYKMGLMEILREKFMPTDDEGKPTGGGMWSVQVDIIYRGLAHNGPAITRKRVEQWMLNACSEDQGVIPMLVAAFQAVLSSGVLGMRVTFDEPEPEDEEGKEQAESSQSPTSETT